MILCQKVYRPCMSAQNNKIIMQKIIIDKSITQHPTFFSDTKYAHQFPKTRRFPTANPECPVAFYSNQTQLSARKTGIGFGKRSDFTKSNIVSPSSTAYRHKSVFESGNGKTFGCSRQKSPDRSYLIPQLHKHPSPSQYKNQYKKQSKHIYSMGAKTIDMEVYNTNRYTPGPAAYDSIQLENSEGRYNVSKYADRRLGKIDKKVKRFPSIRRTPGPSTYLQKDGEEAGSKYYLSQHRSQGNRAFEKQGRFTAVQWKISPNPGPANYVIPSQFPPLPYQKILGSVLLQ